MEGEAKQDIPKEEEKVVAAASETPAAASDAAGVESAPAVESTPAKTALAVLGLDIGSTKASVSVLQGPFPVVVSDFFGFF